MQRTCSQKLDYLLNSKIVCTKFIESGFHEKKYSKDNKAGSQNGKKQNVSRPNPRKRIHTKNISTWHSKLNAIPSILKNNFYFISNDSKLSNIFKQKLTSTYQKNNITFWLPSEKKTLQPHSNV